MCYMDRLQSTTLKHYGEEADTSSPTLLIPSRPQIAFAVRVPENISTAAPALTGRGMPFSYSLLFSKSFYQATNGGEIAIRYEYNYQNSKDSLEEVEKTLKAEWTPDFSRNIHIANATTLSEATTSIHLRELERRGKSIKVGKEWIHRENISDLEIWQLKRVINRLDQKQELAKKLEDRYQQKLKLRKEYLREAGEEMSSWKFEQEQEEVLNLEDKVNHYREKQKWLRESKRRVFGMIKEIRESNSKESRPDEPLLKSEPNKVTA